MRRKNYVLEAGIEAALVAAIVIEIGADAGTELGHASFREKDHWLRYSRIRSPCFVFGTVMIEVGTKANFPPP